MNERAVGDWWICECGAAWNNTHSQVCEHSIDYCRPLHLTSDDWLRCHSLDALKAMLIQKNQKISREVTEYKTEAELRCCEGNPFRPWTPSPDVLQWRDGTVGRVAQLRYCDSCSGVGTKHDRQASILYSIRGRCGRCGGTGMLTPDHAILADALEEAGETREDVLGHLREREWACDCGHCINGGLANCLCKKSYTRPIQHLPGCFVLRAILEGGKS